MALHCGVCGGAVARVHAVGHVVGAKADLSRQRKGHFAGELLLDAIQVRPSGSDQRGQ